MHSFSHAVVQLSLGVSVHSLEQVLTSSGAQLIEPEEHVAEQSAPLYWYEQLFDRVTLSARDSAVNVAVAARTDAPRAH